MVPSPDLGQTDETGPHLPGAGPFRPVPGLTSSQYGPDVPDGPEYGG
jgi:hypothetical protein